MIFTKLEKDEYELDDVCTFREVLNRLNLSRLYAMAHDSEVFDEKQVHAVLDKMLLIPVEANPNLFVITEYTDGLGRYAVDGSLVAPGDIAKASDWRGQGVIPPEAYIDAKMVSLRPVEGEAHHIVLRLLFNILNTPYGKDGGEGVSLDVPVQEDVPPPLAAK